MSHLQTLSAMLGSAWIRYDTWSTVDSTELVVGGANDGMPLWKVGLDEMQAVDEAVCGQCSISTFARRFYFHADLPAFRQFVADWSHLFRRPGHDAMEPDSVRRSDHLMTTTGIVHLMLPIMRL